MACAFVAGLNDKGERDMGAPSVGKGNGHRKHGGYSVLRNVRANRVTRAGRA